jgi:predicted metal-dependent HD superfamily phosphohydrolase
MIEPESLVATYAPQEPPKVLTEYLSADRYYHNLEHIADGLRRLPDLMRVYSKVIRYAEELIVGWIYHDSVYDPLAKGISNEEESAARACDAHRNLNVAALRQIVLASTHELGYWPWIEQRILADIDLAGLASQGYDENTAKIRREYGMFSDTEFWAGRCKWLEDILRRERIYQTVEYFGRYEERARANLQRELSTHKVA